MVSTDQTHENLSRFNQPSKDSLGLGRTPSQRSAEIVAGARAEAMRTPETMALSQYSGRFFAQLIRRLSGNFNFIEFFPARMIGIEALSKRFVSHRTGKLLLVDVASGFSPRALRMAYEFPQAEVVEIDLPHVFNEKRKRLRHAGIELPPNLRWIEADLGSQNLSDILEGRKADLITAEGITLYLTTAEAMRLLQQVRVSLADNGVYISEIYFTAKLNDVRHHAQGSTVVSMFLRQIGRTPGILPSDLVATSMFQEAGFGQIERFPLADLMEEMGQVRPVDVVTLYAVRPTVNRQKI